MSNNNALWQRWVGGEWGECSVTCGEGEQTREILCRQEITPTLTMTVAEGACLTPPSPLLQRTRSCQRLPCPGPGSGGQWSVGAWSQVSAGPMYLLKHLKYLLTAFVLNCTKTSTLLTI